MLIEIRIAKGERPVKEYSGLSGLFRSEPFFSGGDSPVIMKNH
jgi:hypothetical protein